MVGKGEGEGGQLQPAGRRGLQSRGKEEGGVVEVEVGGMVFTCRQPSKSVVNTSETENTVIEQWKETEPKPSLK